MYCGIIIRIQTLLYCLVAVMYASSSADDDILLSSKLPEFYLLHIAAILGPPLAK